MSYSNCFFVVYWIFCWILNFESLFSFDFQLKKKLPPNVAFCGTFKLLRCLNSKEIKLQSWIRVICTSFRYDFFFSWKLKRKQRLNIWRQFQYSASISTLLIWHDHRIRIVFDFLFFLFESNLRKYLSLNGLQYETWYLKQTLVTVF